MRRPSRRRLRGRGAAGDGRKRSCSWQKSRTLLATGNSSVRPVLQPRLALPPGMVETAMRTASAGEHIGETNEDRRFGFYARRDWAARGRTSDHHRAHGAHPKPAPGAGYNRVVLTSQENVGTKWYNQPINLRYSA